MGFEVFNKRASAVTKHPYVTIQRAGLFSLNEAAHNLLGGPEAVELLYDRDTQRIGFRATSSEKPSAVPLRTQGGNRGGATTYMAAGRAFTNFYDIDTSVARRYYVQMEDDILVLDLKGGSVEVTGPRANKSSKDASE